MQLNTFTFHQASPSTSPLKRQIRLQVDLTIDLECRELVQSLTLPTAGPVGGQEVRERRTFPRSLTDQLQPVPGLSEQAKHSL